MNTMENSSEETERDWEKLKETARNQGFREGVFNIQESAFQEYFDQGYAEGFRNGKELGKLKGIRTLETILNASSEMDLSTLKPSLALCQLCDNDKLLSQSINEIIEQQREIVTKHISK